MNLAEAIRHLKNSGQSEDRLVADFIDELQELVPCGGSTSVITSCDEIIEAAVMVKKAATPPKLVIKQEPYIDMNPRKEWENLGTMFCWHPRYVLGDEQPHDEPMEWLKYAEPFFVRLPLHLYDHGGITMSTSPFSCSWDSGQVGWIVAELADVREMFGVKAVNGAIKKKVTEILEAEVKVYDQYLRGAVWYYSYDDDSCGGFFGDDLEETGIIDALEQHEIPREVIEAAWEARS